MDRVRAAIEKHGTGLIWSPNFSIGVNVFCEAGARSRATPCQRGAVWSLAWEITTPPKTTRPLALLIKIGRSDEGRGYNRAIDASSKPGRRAPPAPTKSVSIPRGHHYAAALGTQPGRIRARRAESRAVDSWKGKAFLNSAKSCLRGNHHVHSHVQRVWHCVSDSIPQGSVAR